jgi:hypothetical protein
VERLFSLTRDKLMKIPSFAWTYKKYLEAMAWLKSTEAWQAMRAISRAVRKYFADLRKPTSVELR